MSKRLRAIAMAATLAIVLTTPIIPIPAASAEKIPELNVIGNPQSYNNDYKQYLGKYSGYLQAERPVEIDIKNLTKDSTGTVLSKDAKAVEISDDAAAYWNVSIPNDALYNIEITYMAASSISGDMELSLQIDGKVPFKEVTLVSFKRSYLQSTDNFPINTAGNDIKPEVKESFNWKTYTIADPSGYNTKPFSFAFSKGHHSLGVKGSKGKIAIAKISLLPLAELQTYAQYHSKNDGYKKAEQTQPIIIEAEKLTYKSSQTIFPVTDRTSATTSPQSASRLKLNTLGGNNWSRIGDSVTWTFEVKKSGLYEIGTRYRQSYIDGIFTSRKLLIDDHVPFEEASHLRFRYASKWQTEKFGGNKTPYQFYLDAGKHTLTLEAVAGDVAELIGQIETSISELNNIYRRIVQITGTSPDPYRDYKFNELIPDQIASMAKQRDILQNTVNKIDKAAGSNGSYTAVIKKIIFQLNNMATKPSEISKTLENFKSNLGAMSSWLLSATSQPLLLDCLYIAPNDSYHLSSENVFSNLAFGLKCFIYSFNTDYSSIGQIRSAKYAKTLKIWTQTGRDQAEILRQLIDSSFTAKYQTNVKLETVAPGTLLQSVLSGLSPDAVLDNLSSEPINYAVRNAVIDLSKFADYKKIAERFPANASIPYTYEGKVYALPQTFSFLMFFYRTDIFEEYNLTVPKTWDDFIKIITIFQKDGLTVGLPHDMNAYAMFLYQNGGNLYRDNYKKTNLQSNEAMNSFLQLTEFFTLYSMPPAFDFANRFRSGEMPCAVQDYTQYNQLTVFAPEIKGRWKMAEVPGVLSKDGINNTSIGTGTAAMIMKGSKNKELAWDFLKWYMQADVQSRYALEMESILGPAGKVATANMEALTQMSWSRDEYTHLFSQLKSVELVPEVPGSYYLPRVITFAFNRVYNSSSTQSMAEDPTEVLGDYISDLNNELARKQAEFKGR